MSAEPRRAGPGFLRKTALLTYKDLRIEARGRDTLVPMVMFCITVTLLLAFTVPSLDDLPLASVIAGFLWVTVLFAGLIGFARTFEVERVDGAIDPLLLAPVDRSALFLAKASANLAYIVAVQAILIPLFVLLFRIPLGGNWPVFLAVVLLVDVGYVVIGTLFASLAAHTSSRELMLPILALPALVPIFIAAVELSADLFSGLDAGAVAGRGWFGILIAFDVIFAIVGALIFEFALDP
jgi:heme exporter protein B